VINPIVWIADRIASSVTEYPRVNASHDCAHCGARQGNRHRLSGCEGNERDVRRGIVVDYAGEVLTDDEVDRRFGEALEQHRQNEAEREKRNEQREQP